jgi:hypothetical protein
LLDVFGSRNEYLVISELDLALEYRPVSVVFPSIELDVIDLLLIACFHRIALDMLAGDTVRG